MNTILRFPGLRATAALGLLLLAACSGGGGGGSYESAPAAGVAPTFASQPAALTVNAGQSATFSATATGTPAPSMQWERSPDGSAWSAISGATSATYSFTAAKADHGIQYRARAANASGTATTVPVGLTVHWAPEFVSQPANQTVTSPNPAQFTMAMDCNPDSSSQWQSSPDGASWQDIPGATGASYSTGPTSSGMNSMKFRCVCTNLVGSTASSAATLIVDAPSSALAVNLGAGTSGTPATGGSYPTGTQVNYAYAPLEGYAGLQVLLDGNAVPTNGSFTMDGPRTLSVSATPVLRQVTFTAGAGGSVTGSSSQSVPNGGSTSAVTAVPAGGYAFVNWTGAGFTSSTTNPLVIPAVIADLSITANFSPIAVSYTLAASAGAHGSISPAGSSTVSAGASMTYTITADPSYVVADVLVDGVSVGAVSSYTFLNVTANHTIAATFAAPAGTYTITATAGIYGTISPAGLVAVPAGGSMTFAITADVYYTVVDVKVDGVSLGSLDSYTFTNVTGNHTISARFY